MKSHLHPTGLYLVATALVVLGACQSTPPAPTRAAPSPAEVDWDDRTVFQEGLIEAERALLDGMAGASTYHIEVRIANDLLSLQGQETVRYTNQEDVPLDALYFQLFPNAAGGSTTVSAVTVDGQKVEPQAEFQNSAVRLPLPSPLQPGEAAVIAMDFEVAVAREMGGNYGLFGYFDDVLVLDGFYPVIPVYDDEGWNVQDPPPNGDVTYFDASFYLVRVTAPDDLVLVTSGVETGREYADGEQILTFAAGPARDFYMAASEEYVVVSRTVGETTVNSYAPRRQQQGAEHALQFAVMALQSFGQRFGAYPYTEYDVASTPMLALGMEYPGMTAIALNLYDPDGDVLGLPFPVVLESTVAHEVAHQWFYNVVGNDQVDEPWVDEAIVQYVTGLYFLDAYGPAAAQSFQDSWEDRWNRVDGADIPIGLPTGDYTGQEYGAIVYGRGPLFIAALAEQLGQETFDEFLRDYYQSHQWGIGTGDAFRQMAEQHCQCDLHDIFAEWVYGE
ncbi:MAG: M1 family metallopeptidase [Anaerolineae bacterium]|nr:M1 family metallopeptidase [Anaerolineae bacterium]